MRKTSRIETIDVLQRGAQGPSPTTRPRNPLDTYMIPRYLAVSLDSHASHISQAGALRLPPTNFSAAGFSLRSILAANRVISLRFRRELADADDKESLADVGCDLRRPARKAVEVWRGLSRAAKRRLHLIRDFVSAAGGCAHLPLPQIPTYSDPVG